MIKFRLADGTYKNVKPEHLEIFKQRYPDAMQVGGEPTLSPKGLEIIALEESLKQLKQQSQSEQEVSNWVGFKNSVKNLAEMIGDVPEFYDITGDEEEGSARSTADILSTAVNEAIFGKENILKWREEGGMASWIWEDYIPSHDEEIVRQIESYKKEREKHENQEEQR